MDIYIYMCVCVLVGLGNQFPQPFLELVGYILHSIDLCAQSLLVSCQASEHA